VVNLNNKTEYQQKVVSTISIRLPAQQGNFADVPNPLSIRCVSRSTSRTAIRPVSQSASHSRSHAKLNARSERSSKCWFYWI